MKIKIKDMVLRKVIIKSKLVQKKLLNCKLNKVKQYIKRSLVEEKLKKIYNDKKVIRGPFKGMEYTNYIAAGSSLYPKIAGVYEFELQGIIEKCMKKEYEYFIDVGCAEGYYAVGMSKYGNINKSLAYDIDQNARKLCKDMLRTNKITNCEIRSQLTPQELSEFKFNNSKLSFLMVDCEGFERELFNDKTIQNLKRVECLIEIHDWCQDEIPTRNILLKLFYNSHKCILIKGIDDYEKAYTYYLPELNDFSIEERFMTFAEGRKRIGCWLHCIPNMEKNEN